MEEIRDMNRVYSERVRAGKRTYFFDIRKTKSEDYYLTITERKRKFDEEGASFEKFKLFLYKEDLNKFSEAFEKAVTYIKEELMPDYDFSKFDRAPEDSNTIIQDEGNENSTPAATE